MKPKEVKQSVQKIDAFITHLEIHIHTATVNGERIIQKIRDLYAANGLVRFADLAQIPKDEWLEFSQGVHLKQIPSQHDSLIFITKFEPGARLPWHYHDCHENLAIIDGYLESDEPIGRVESFLHIQPFQRHHFVAPEGAIVQVELYR